MAKQKVGLHKQVSEIFDGVLIPKEDGPNELAKTPLSNRLDFLRPKPRVSTPASVPARWDAGADTKTSATHRACHAAPGPPSARPKQSKITIVIKAFKQIRQHIFHPGTTWLKR
jgi:hypothetical protein